MTYDKVKYNAQYNKQNYTELKLRIPKGRKAIIEEHWKAKGYKSLNAYVNDLIRKDMEDTERQEIGGGHCELGEIAD